MCEQVAIYREKFPEKIPFRLTRMLIKAMEVSGSDLGETSVNLLSAPLELQHQLKRRFVSLVAGQVFFFARKITKPPDWREA